MIAIPPAAECIEFLIPSQVNRIGNIKVQIMTGKLSWQVTFI
jgi:hypothetical protein